MGNEEEKFAAEQKVKMEQCKVGQKDPYGRKILKIFFATNDGFIVYTVENPKPDKPPEFVFSTFASIKKLDDHFKTRVTEFKDGYYKCLKYINEFDSCNTTNVRVQIAYLLNKHIHDEINSPTDHFENFAKELEKAHKYIYQNKIAFRFSHLIWIILTLFIMYKIFKQIDMTNFYVFKKLDIVNWEWDELFWCMFGSVLGNYLLTTIGDCNEKFYAENAILRKIFYAFETTIISVILGSITYWLIHSEFSELMFSAIAKSENHSLFIILGMISGFFSTFIPAMLDEVKNKLIKGKE